MSIRQDSSSIATYYIIKYVALANIKFKYIIPFSLHVVKCFFSILRVSFLLIDFFRLPYLKSNNSLLSRI